MPNRFNYQEVRELAWLIASPSLFLPHKFNPTDEWQKVMARLKSLDENPEILLRAIASVKSTRLGFRFEALFGFWIEDLLGRKMLKRNWQIIHDKKTLGEFDFIVEDEGENIHWETAIKFYLACNGKWYGPNAHDRLDLKSNLIFEKQLGFSKREELSQILKNEGIKIHSAEVFAKGILFEHAFGKYGAELPLNVNPRAVCGKWVYLSEFADLKHSEWMLIPHHSWLDPFPNLPILNATEIEKSLQDELVDKDSIMLGLPKAGNLEKWFIVKDNWPLTKD